jgi:hypothetical protein
MGNGDLSIPSDTLLKPERVAALDDPVEHGQCNATRL